MGLAILEPLLTGGPWAFALVVCAPMIAIVVMFVFAILRVPRDESVEAIRAMADLIRALRPGRRNRLP
ncbi:hypothetical protein AB0C07_29265 [Actinoplanes missouriensis]|uniref:hypothetical protein n=1 Tax=Actinoplanes missouriensis TaxID=1866 RepID=UPI0033E042C7